MDLDPADFDLSWLLESDDGTVPVAATGDIGTASEPRPRPRKQGCKQRPGPRRIDEEFPMAVNIAKSFIEANGFEAHRRRQTTTGKCGVSLRDIRAHLFNSVPELQEKHPQLGNYNSFDWLVY